MTGIPRRPSPLRRLWSLFGWTKHSTVLLGGFFLIVFLIIYVWWPLAEEVLAYVDWSGPWWRYFDWLLVGVFLFMTLTIISRADLRTDALIVFVGTFGGLVIESWGTQTNLWFYYTAERPPLWIIPAWPIASLAIDRMVRFLEVVKLKPRPVFLSWAYWGVFLGFYGFMLIFVRHTIDKPLTWMALLLVGLLILSPGDRWKALLWFAAGTG
jgi:hypothetical protein